MTEGKEIERKFLLREDGQEYLCLWVARDQPYSSMFQLAGDVLSLGTPIEQGYMDAERGKGLAELLDVEVHFDPVEARLRRKGDRFYFTLKGDGTVERDELEREIDQQFFERHWTETEGRRVSKTRLEVPYHGLTLEIDVYRDRDLCVVEVAVPTREAAEKMERLGKDVTADKKYKNKNLAK